ncbi:MAG: M61 family metallopeptidase [Candidatus Kapabacteria bacterium]|nr:M61 family metallopeptidase [Candidatus Kapabacteria bacterium]
MNSRYSIEQRDEQLLNSQASITYTLDFGRAAEHIMAVTLHISNIITDTVSCILPSWIPGSYKIRDMVSDLSDVRAFAQGKELSAQWVAKDEFFIQTQGTNEITVTYLVYANTKTPRNSHINRWHAFVMPVCSLLYVEGRMNEIHHVKFLYNQQEWKECSTSLSPVFPTNDNTLYGALNYDILADSIIEIGNHVVKTFEVLGAKHELALVSNAVIDADWIVKKLEKIVSTEATMFGNELPYDRYVFFLLCSPGIYGGLEHARSSVNAVDPSAFSSETETARVLELLCHEFFHTWNIKRIRPRELGPFNYRTENYTGLLWLAEGLTSYYDTLFMYRCGFFTQQKYLDVLAKDNLGALDKVPGRFSLSLHDSSFLAWVKLYAMSPDMRNRFPSYYLKGGVFFWLLDLYIIIQSNGVHRLDDGVRGLWKQYQQNPEIGVTEEDIINIISQETKVDVSKVVKDWVYGKEELPYEEIFSQFGLVYSKKPIAITRENDELFSPKKLLGITVSDKNGTVVVDTVTDGTPARKAGIAVDDCIIAINSKHTLNVNSFEAILTSLPVGELIEITAVCDGRLYTTSLTLEIPFEYTLTISEQLTENQKAYQSLWLL